jgi:hypothetical protein
MSVKFENYTFKNERLTFSTMLAKHGFSCPPPIFTQFDVWFKPQNWLGT